MDNIPSLRATLGLDRIKTVVTNRQYGAETLDGVFDNIDLRLPLDMAAAMLEVDLTITGDLNCIVGASCPALPTFYCLKAATLLLTETNDLSNYNGKPKGYTITAATTSNDADLLYVVQAVSEENNQATANGFDLGGSKQRSKHGNICNSQRQTMP